jgi:hypothetical protein
MQLRAMPVLVTLLVFLIAATVLAATIDPVNRTVTTSTLFVDWSETNPEEILDIRWNGSANLTNHAAASSCPSDLEYFGNSWVTQDEGTPSFVFFSLVGWGTTGTWTSPNSNRVSANSISTGCFGSANLPIETNYHFFDRGAPVNRIMVQRRFTFGSVPFAYDVRPYIPRLYPKTAYTQVLHPNASNTVLVTEDVTLCDFGCRVDDWNDGWFAIHNPTTGQGLIVRRDRSAYDVALWVDQDDASFTNASSVLLLQPSGGFTGRVTEVEFLCFYDSGTWTPSLTLPAGC